MEKLKGCTLSIAGYDPSGGAGVIADTKTFEALQVRGMAVVSAVTFQNDHQFEEVKWIPLEDILKQYDILTRRFSFTAIKIGLIRDFHVLQRIVDHVTSSSPQSYIVWDPILKASAGYQFHEKTSESQLAKLLDKMYLVTPNIEEALALSGKSEEIEAAKTLASYSHVLLKGGHSTKELGIDYLFTDGAVHKLTPMRYNVSPKHGSGCVLSAALVSYLSKGENLKTSCLQAKKYTEKYLCSTPHLLGNHYV